MSKTRITTRYKRQTAIQLDHTLYEWLLEESQRTGKSQSAIIRLALDVIRSYQLSAKAA